MPIKEFYLSLYMYQPYKLKAGALLSVAGIAVIIAVLLGTMLLLLLYNRNDTAKQMRKLKLERNLQSATAMVLDQPYEESDQIERQLDLFDEETESISLQSYHWGIYAISIIKSFENNDTLSTVFLKGNHINPEKSYALYLKDDERPLSVSGTTVIRGTAYLPPAGVRKAYIEDKAYETDSAIYGPIKTSEKQLPGINTAMVEQLKQLFYDSLQHGKVDLNLIMLANLQDTTVRSFYEKPVCIARKDSISLEGMTLKGAVILTSKTAIYVPSTAVIEQALLFAPKIIIADDFEGTLQAFAQDSILVGENCLFRYPSVLGLLEGANEQGVREMVPEISVGKNSIVNGVVFSIAAAANADFMNRIRLDTNSSIDGEVYADGLLEVKGRIYGSAACQRFLLQTTSSLYDNFVLDAEIDYTKRSPYYLSGALTEGKGGILKWLY